MLRSLSIRDVVLIGRLDVPFTGGLCVLTGETGAGKSILLDSLGLALGERAEARLVRPGAAQAAVSAEFALSTNHPVRALLVEHGLEDGGEALILRRILGADGRSRAFVNDQPVSVGLLRQIGESCVEIHGQFENQRLMRAATHRALLDAYGGLEAEVRATRETFAAWREAIRARSETAHAVEQARREEDFLRHAVEELVALAPEPGEEDSLAARRALMMHSEKLIAAMSVAAEFLSEGRGVESALRSAASALERVSDKAEGRLDETLAALDRAAVETAEAMAQLERAGIEFDLDPQALEKIEERLFALRAVARKHGVAVDDLPALRTRMEADLVALEDGGARLADLERAEAEAKAAFGRAAESLSAGRVEAAARLDTAVASELAPLKLGLARFETRISRLEEEAWGEFGADAVVFEVSTNPGMPPGPLQRISSGGELARFMLALKVVLARADPVPTMVFDEVDAGVGGAVAAAVGERLARLGGDFQVLVVTHSPQVAARGGHHLRVAKAEDGVTATTTVHPLDAPARTEEIARMLAGARITDEARAAAESLLGGTA